MIGQNIVKTHRGRSLLRKFRKSPAKQFLEVAFSLGIAKRSRLMSHKLSLLSIPLFRKRQMLQLHNNAFTQGVF